MTTRYQNKGNFGKAYLFDGNDYITIASNSKFNFGGDANHKLLLGAIIYLFKLGTTQYILAREDKATPEGNYALYINSSDQLAYRYYASGAWQTHVDDVSKITSGVTYEVEVIHDMNANTVDFYVNGINTKHITGATDATAPAGSLDLTIGATKNGASKEDYFNGIIDEVIIKITTGTAPTVKTGGSTEPYVSDSDTKGLYHLDGNANDSSGSPVANGTVTGATVVSRGFYKNTVTVAKEGGDFQKIQDAIDYINNNESPSSSNIWTVLVYPGEYDDGYTYPKSYINIIGIDRNSCILKNRIIITRSNILIENLTVNSPSGAISIDSVDNNNISDVILKHLDIIGTDGITSHNNVSYTTSYTAESCYIKGTSSRGLYIADNTVSCILRNCHIESVQKGIANSSTIGLILECNACKIIGGGSYVGIDIGTKTAKLYNCRIEKGASATYAIDGSSGGSVTLGECSLEGDINSALTITYKKDFKMDNSTVEISTDTLRVKDSGITAAKLATDAVETAKTKAGAVDLTTKVAGVLPVANGGTGSSTEKYVELAGDTMSGDLIIDKSDAKLALYEPSGHTQKAYLLLNTANNDVTIRAVSGKATLQANGDIVLSAGDAVKLTIDDANGDATFVGDIIIDKSDSKLALYNAGVQKAYFLLNTSNNDATIRAVSGDIALQGNNNLKLLTNAATRMTIDSSGNVGIGTTSPQHQLELSINDALKPTSEHWSVPCDKRIKKNIKQIKNALNTILKLEGKQFQYKNPSAHGNFKKSRYGFIAQEVEKIFPEWVSENKPTKANRRYIKKGKEKSLNIFGLDAIMVEAIKELKKENDILKKKIKNLEKIIK